MSTANHKPYYLLYTLLTLCWLGLAWLGAQLVADWALWHALLITPVLAAPLMLAGFYGATIRRIRRASLFTSFGILSRLVTGRLLPYAFWSLWSLASAFLMLIYLRSAAGGEWLLILIALPVFYLLVHVTQRSARKELKPYIALQASLAASRWILAILMALLQMVLASSFTTPECASLAQALASSAESSPPVTSDSILIRETAQLMDWYQGVQCYTLNHLRSVSKVGYLVVVFTGTCAFFYNIGLLLSAFMISPTEYRRIATPVVEVDTPAQVSGRSLAVSVAVTTFVALFVYLPLVAYLELWASVHPGRIDNVRETQQQLASLVEQIEQRYYQPGTIEQISELRARTLATMEPGVAAIRRDSDLGYQLMADNIETYLDWYYSLPAEYGRILALLSGNIEAVLADQLQSHLTRGNPFGQLEQSITEALEQQQALQQTYQDSVESILAANEMLPVADMTPRVIERLSLDEVFTAPSHGSLSGLEGRLLASGAAGAAITGLVATKITAKIVGKGTIKLGAKALAKVAASKASGALGGGAAGAVAGAAAGSVIPGVGTVIGGAIGGIVGGIAVGVSVEALLLRLEEALSREDFKRELLQAIEESRESFNQSLDIAASEATVPGNAAASRRQQEKEIQRTP